MIKQGSIATSWTQLAESSGLTVGQCRGAASKLESTNDISRETVGNFQIITLNNWPKYQLDEDKKVDDSIDWDKLKKFFVDTTGKKLRTVSDKAKKQFRARLREGYTKEDFVNAITNCFNDDYHKETKHKYLTLEFISRADKLEKYAFVVGKKVEKKIEHWNNG